MIMAPMVEASPVLSRRAKGGGLHVLLSDTLQAFAKVDCTPYNVAVLLTALGTAPQRAEQTMAAASTLVATYNAIASVQALFEANKGAVTQLLVAQTTLVDTSVSAPRALVVGRASLPAFGLELLVDPLEAEVTNNFLPWLMDQMDDSLELFRELAHLLPRGRGERSIARVTYGRRRLARLHKTEARRDRDRKPKCHREP